MHKRKRKDQEMTKRVKRERRIRNVRERENSFALRTSLEWSEIASKLTTKKGRKGKKELKTQLTDFKLKQDMQI
ncbi:hypothetical protein BofuT4_uP058060.1 [Botrytis cinerea T4]|uniref:Uncharacterized protein n=1 Tax=Botryotinia fuckeliana (strain T4) TaxID=999810 RepID=G2XUQ6_BOTF4|nr:hypothetical protein BofuT4_uP058060.1 [Botrytis cinerea T4]